MDFKLGQNDWKSKSNATTNPINDSFLIDYFFVSNQMFLAVLFCAVSFHVFLSSFFTGSWGNSSLFYLLNVFVCVSFYSCLFFFRRLHRRARISLSEWDKHIQGKFFYYFLFVIFCSHFFKNKIWFLKSRFLLWKKLRLEKILKGRHTQKRILKTWKLKKEYYFWKIARIHLFLLLFVCIDWLIDSVARL